MTITRADVEKLLHSAELVDEPKMVALCRTWIAVHDAPSGETDSYLGGYVTLRSHDAYIPAGTYKLVCIETPQRERKWYDEGTPVNESEVSNAVGPGGIETPTGGREG